MSHRGAWLPDDFGYQPGRQDAWPTGQVPHSGGEALDVLAAGAMQRVPTKISGSNTPSQVEDQLELTFTVPSEGIWQAFWSFGIHVTITAPGTIQLGLTWDDGSGFNDPSDNSSGFWSYGADHAEEIKGINQLDLTNLVGNGKTVKWRITLDLTGGAALNAVGPDPGPPRFHASQMTLVRVLVP